MPIHRLLVAAGFALAIACLRGPAVAEDSPPDSLTEFAPYRFVLRPVARITHDGLDACSGMAHAKERWYAINGGRGDAVVYQSGTAASDYPVALPVPGAACVDWTALTTWGDDLLICDVGDAGQSREHVTLYRVSAAAQPGEPLRLLATYRIAYPDGPHHAEAVFVADDTVYVVPKTGAASTLYAFGQLMPDKLTVGQQRPGPALPAGSEVLDAVVRQGRLTLVTQEGLYTWPRGVLRGPPARATHLHARRCGALAFHGAALWFANGWREVFCIDSFAARRIDEALPARPITLVPHVGNQQNLGRLMSVSNTTHGEFVRIAATLTHVVVEGSLVLEAPFIPASADGRDEPGTGLVLGFSARASRTIEDDALVFAVGVDEKGQARAQAFGPHATARQESLHGIEARMSLAREGSIGFSVSIPRALVARAKLINFMSWRGGRADPAPRILAGYDLASFLRPMLWSPLRFE